MGKKLDIGDYIGKTFHYLTIESLQSETNINGKITRFVNCRCKCGNNSVRNLASIKRGMTRSCGCLIKETHTKVGYNRRTKDIKPGDVFGNLTVLYEIEKRIPREIFCKCICGNEKSYNLSNLLKGNTNSCGCMKITYQRDNGLKQRKIHLQIGDVYGRLTILKEIEGRRYGKQTRVQRQYECRCECGNTCIVQLRNLKISKTVSCGCYGKEKRIESATKHNQYKTSEYKAWLSMKQRCYNPKTTHYESYGGRGIRVCDRWLESFENFYEDMGPKPGPTYSIDRIDNYKLENGYSKENCRWATKTEQVQNRRIMNK